MIARAGLGRRRREPPVAAIAPDALNRNPYPIYKELRDDLPVVYAPTLNHVVLVSRWTDVETVLKDDETFSAEIEPPAMPETLRGSLLFTDGHEHTRMRNAMQPRCQPRPSRAVAESFVAGACDELLDRLVDDGDADLVGSYFEPLALQTLTKVTGFEFPLEELREWENHAAHYFKMEPAPGDAERTNAEIDAALLECIHAPQEDSSLVSDMVRWRDADGGLTEKQILASLKVFLAAGINELRDLMAHTLIGLLSRPEQLEEMRNDPLLAAGAVEEGARWGSPVGLVPRMTTSPTELGGYRLSSGRLVGALVASANRDERRWSDSGRFDLHRDEGMHFGFASGVHFCLGAWLARSAGTVALQRLVDRLPGLRLAAERPLAVTGWRFREVRRLRADWDPT